MGQNAPLKRMAYARRSQRLNPVSRPSCSVVDNSNNKSARADSTKFLPSVVFKSSLFIHYPIRISHTNLLVYLNRSCEFGNEVLTVIVHKSLSLFLKKKKLLPHLHIQKVYKSSSSIAPSLINQCCILL